VYRGLLNLSVVGSVLALINGAMSAGWFSHVFQALSLASMAPLILAAIVPAILSLLRMIKGLVVWLAQSKEDVGLTGLGGAAAGAVLVTAGVDHAAIQDGIADTREEREERDKESAEARGAGTGNTLSPAGGSRPQAARVVLTADFTGGAGVRAPVEMGQHRVDVRGGEPGR